MLQPEVIFLDAVGTLFGIQGSVGEIYSQFATQVGVRVDPVRLDQAFVHSFRSAPRAAFPGVAPEEITTYEFNWWQAIARQSFQQVGVLDQFADFDAFFVHLFEHFATAAPWFVYPDTREALSYWQQQKVKLGIISNFDSRLYPVLEALDLAQFFSTVTISTSVGSAKPDQLIFTAALKQQQCAPAVAWHIGDSWTEDFQGAKAAGLNAVWLQRDANSSDLEPTDGITVPRLTALLPTAPTQE